MNEIADLIEVLADRLYPAKPAEVDQPVPNSTVGPVSYAKTVPEPLGDHSIFEGKSGEHLWKRLRDSADLSEGPFEKLGSGTRGTAYQVDDSRVLKLTNDESEAIGAALIRDNPDPRGNAQRIFSVWVLKTPDEKGWAVVQELLDPMPDDDPWTELADLWPAWSRANDYAPIIPENVTTFFDDVEQEGLADSEAFAEFRTWFTELAAYLESIELLYHDFWHRNLLMRGEQHVAIDFGYSESMADPPPDIDVISRFEARASARKKV